MSPRTYWHLAGLKHKPTAYEIGSTRVLYYPGRGGFEVAHPVADWYQAHQAGSPFQVPDWDAFADPAAMTYRDYVARRHEQELFVTGLHASIDGTDYDRELDPAWLDLFARVVAPLRFPVHGLQMIAAYVGQLAPGGRVAIAALFQTADELRRVQRLAYRLAELRQTYPELGRDARELWQTAPEWQPLRQIVERLLTCYDWGEAFVGLNLVLKPRFDELVMTHLAMLARGFEDDLLAKLFYSLNEDCRWHRAWSGELVRTALRARPENREPLVTWIDRWTPLARAAVEGLAGMFDEGRDRIPGCSSAGVLEAIEETIRAFAQAWGIES
jgi:hypothetical protein